MNRRTFLVWSPVAPAAVAESLGLPEYSYGFVLARFRPVLESLGDVIEVADPTTEVDAHYDRIRAASGTCWFLCFAPPHRAPTGLRCPTTTIFAWEFDTIPDEPWGGHPTNDWRVVLADHGRAIVLSTHTAAAVRRSMGPDYPVAAIPAPVVDRFRLPRLRRTAPLAPRTITVTGTVIDAAELTYRDTGIGAERLGTRLARGDWDGQPVTLDVASGQDGAARLVGFYHPEPWGSWTRVAEPAVLLPYAIAGPVEVVVTAHGLGRNAGRRITVTLGDSTGEFRLRGRRRDARVRLHPTHPAATLQFANIAADVPPGLDERTMGMGLVRITLRRPSVIPPKLARVFARNRQGPPVGLPDTETSVRVQGVLYTSVLNPVDHRKNWPALLSAFCWTFRDEPDAVLLLKMTHRSPAAYAADLQDVLHRIGPTRCRVIVVHGFLPDDGYERLIEATTYYANASSAEGLCMPLMEFLGAGVPAVATDNTAMADYLSDDCAFVVRSSPGYTHWPHDDRRRIRAVEHRVDWDSLCAAFAASFAAAADAPQYAALAAAARDRLQAGSSDEVVADRLLRFLDAQHAEPGTP